MEMAVRLLKPDQFAMTARVVVPLMPELMTRAELMEEVFIKAPALKRLQPGELASDPRFAVGVYREAVAAGVMDFIRFERKQDQLHPDEHGHAADPKPPETEQRRDHAVLITQH
jgi:hypothetical protein